MHGQNNNLELVNKLFSSSNSIDFIKVEDNNITSLTAYLRELRKEVITNYEYDTNLLLETEIFLRLCKRVMITLKEYNVFLNEVEEQIIQYFSFTKNKIYDDLFNNIVLPIARCINNLRNQNRNAYIDEIKKIKKDKDLSGVTFIISRTSRKENLSTISGIETVSPKEFLERKIFAENLLFIGTPYFYEKKFSTIYYAKNTFFLGYSCFDNYIDKNILSAFSDVLDVENEINTILQGVKVNKGYRGYTIKETINPLVNDVKDNGISEMLNVSSSIKTGRFQAILAYISNQNFILLPTEQKILTLDRNSLIISYKYVKQLNINDLLLFREQNASKLVFDIANEIMGANALENRKLLDKWKRRLIHNVKVKGIKKVSKILTEKYKIKVAREQNIKNWMSEESIIPSCLEELLIAFKFSGNEQKEILKAARSVHSAHIKAGHKISSVLKEEIEQNIGHLDDEGFYSFESNNFKGANFKVEELKGVSDKIFMVREQDLFKIIRRGEYV